MCVIPGGDTDAYPDVGDGQEETGARAGWRRLEVSLLYRVTHNVESECSVA